MAQTPQKLPSRSTIWTRNFTCAMLANFLMSMSHFAVNTLVATYATHLGAGPVLMGFLTGMFFGVALAIRPISGPLMTKVDKRLLMISIFALGSVVNIGYALFRSIPAFVFFRFLHGVQYSFMGALIMTVASDSLPPEKMASGIGVFGVGSAIGQAVGPTIGYTMERLGQKVFGEEEGFTLVFLFAVVATAAAIIPSVLLRPDKRSKEEVQSAGAWYENIVTVHALPATLVNFFLSMASSLYVSYLFNFGVEKGIENINLFFTITAITLVISRIFSGYLTDRYGLKKVVLPGMVLIIASFLIVGFSRSLTPVLIAAVLSALGTGATNPALQAMCMQSVPSIKRSVASNTLYIGIDLALFLGPLYGSVVYKYSDYATVFISGVAPVILGFVSFLFVLPMYQKRRRELESAFQSE